MPEIGDTLPAPGAPAPAGEPAASGQGGTPPAAPPAPPATEKAFTQEDLDRYAGRRAGEVKRTTQKELADELGVDLATAKKMIADQRAAEDAAKTEAQRDREAAAAEKAEAAAAKAEAAQERFGTKLEGKLARAGVAAHLGDSEEDQKQRDKLMARALSMVNLPADADDDTITAEIESLKADVPGLFTTATPSGGTPAPSGFTPGAQPPAGGQPPTSGLERGRERARALRPDPDKQNDPFAGPAFRRVG